MIERWIMPCSIKFYDVIKHFESHNQIVWKKPYSIKKNDLVYIYVGRPYSEIKYRCRVVDDNLDEDTIKNNKYAVPRGRRFDYKYTLLELECSYPEGTFKYLDLKEHGLTQVQKQARVSKELSDYLTSVEDSLPESR